MANEDETSFLQDNAVETPLLGLLPVAAGVLEADRLGIAVYDHVPALRKAAQAMAAKIYTKSEGESFVLADRE